MSNPYTKGAGVLDGGEVSGSGSLPPGVATGDFLRFNAITGLWEVAEELIAIKGVTLTPTDVVPPDVEGTAYYDASEKSVKVCTSI